MGAKTPPTSLPFTHAIAFYVYLVVQYRPAMCNLLGAGAAPAAMLPLYLVYVQRVLLYEGWVLVGSCQVLEG